MAVGEAWAFGRNPNALRDTIFDHHRYDGGSATHFHSSLLPHAKPAWASVSGLRRARLGDRRAPREPNLSVACESSRDCTDWCFRISDCGKADCNRLNGKPRVGDAIIAMVFECSSDVLISCLDFTTYIMED